VAGFNEGRSRPGGSGSTGTSGSVQFKSGSSFAGDTEFNYNPTTDYLTVTGTISASVFYGDGSNLTGIGGGGTPGGSDTEIQFNQNGSFAGSSVLTTDGTGSLTVGGGVTLGDGDDKIIHLSGSIGYPGLQPEVRDTIDFGNSGGSFRTLYINSISEGTVGVRGVTIGTLTASNGIISQARAILGNAESDYHQVTGTLNLSGSTTVGANSLTVLGASGVDNGGPVIFTKNTASFGDDWESPMSGTFIISDDIGTSGVGYNGAAVMYVHSKDSLAAIGFKNEETLVGSPLSQSNSVTSTGVKGVWLGLQGNILQLQNNIGDTIIRAGDVGVGGENEIIVSRYGTTIGNHVDDVHQVTGTLGVLGDMSASINISASAFYGDGSTLSGVGETRVAYASTTTITDATTIAGVTSGSITLTLPSVSTFDGTKLIIKDESGTVSGSNTVIVSGSGVVTIDGATTATISSPYGAISTYHNGTNWFIY